MFYCLIRWIILLIVLISLVVKIKKSKILRKKLLYFISVSISLVMSLVIVLTPVENLFVTFDSPESVFKYDNMGLEEIDLVVDGNFSTFIIDREGNTNTYSIIPKVENGWKLRNGFAELFKHSSYSPHCKYAFVTVYQYTDMSDYYVTISPLEDYSIEISDSCGTQFFSLTDTSEAADDDWVTYIGHISDFKEGYFLTVNDQKIQFEDFMDF